MQVQWKWQIDLSAMHAAWCINNWRERIQNCSAELIAAAEQLFEFRSAVVAAPEVYWATLLTLAVDGQRNRDLAERLLTRLASGARSPAQVSDFMARLSALEKHFNDSFPNYARDIALRVEPLKQQWEAHGPGMMVLMGRATEPDLIVEHAELFVVQPIVGGAGFAHLKTNRAHVEGVLTHPDDTIPETLRVAWLISQLDFERPVYSELINSANLERVAGLAMVPPTLLAASELGLCEFSVDSLQRAIELWHIAEPSAYSKALAAVLMTWWQTYEAGRPEWRIALTGLDRMLTE